MRSSNPLSGGLRSSEVGLVWREIKSGGGLISFQIPKQTAVRVRAAAAITVTFDGILAMSMASGEIAVMNSGNGLSNGLQSDSNNQTVNLIVDGNCFIQIAPESQGIWEGSI
jgi:hypothetical protein